jgi:hypothetical protein
MSSLISQPLGTHTHQVSGMDEELSRSMLGIRAETDVVQDQEDLISHEIQTWL